MKILSKFIWIIVVLILVINSVQALTQTLKNPLTGEEYIVNKIGNREYQFIDGNGKIFNSLDEIKDKESKSQKEISSLEKEK